MSRSLHLIALTREARREAALTRLATAKSHCDQTHRDCQQAHAELEQSKEWHAEVQGRCSLGSEQALRESVLPACEALLQQRLQHFTGKQTALRIALEHVDAERQALLSCERDLLRLQEWKTLQLTEHRRELAMQETRLDDDHMPRRPVQAGMA